MVAVDVSVTASEPDAEEVAKERQSLFLDATLITAEALLSTVYSNAIRAVTPAPASTVTVTVPRSGLR